MSFFARHWKTSLWLNLCLKCTARLRDLSVICMCVVQIWVSHSKIMLNTIIAHRVSPCNLLCDLGHSWTVWIIATGCTVACKSIHPPSYFSYFVALQAGIKMDFLGGICIIWFIQHAYLFEDAKYVLLWNKQEIRQKTEEKTKQKACVTIHTPKVNAL